MKTRTKTKPHTISWIIPALNEESTIARVISRIPQNIARRVEIIVVDNGSNDRTAETARRAGARVVYEQRRGKGNAIRAGLRAVNKGSEYVFMIDADDTYAPEEAPRLLELLTSGFADVAVGSRLQGRIQKGALSFLHRLGNWFLTFLFRMLYRSNATDLCSGFVAWRRSAANDVLRYTREQGFAIETEALAKLSKLGYAIYSTPITYAPRSGASRLKSLSDGATILATLAKLIFWVPK